MDTLHALNLKYSYPTLQHHQDPETRNLGLEDRTLDLNRHSPQLKLRHPKSFLLLLLWVKVTFLFGILSRRHFLKGIFWQELTCKIVARPSFPVVNATFLFLWHSFPQTFPLTQSLLAHLVVLLHIFCCRSSESGWFGGILAATGARRSTRQKEAERLNQLEALRPNTPLYLRLHPKYWKCGEKLRFDDFGLRPLCFWQLETSQRAAPSSHHPSSPRKRFSTR